MKTSNNSATNGHSKHVHMQPFHTSVTHNCIT